MTVFGVWIIQFLPSDHRYTNSYGPDFYVREYMTNRYVVYLLMIGGGIWFIFCLFMLSLSGSCDPRRLKVNELIQLQIILAQGIGAGLAIGLMYVVPRISVVSHYFQRRRPFAIGVANSGAGLGEPVRPEIYSGLVTLAGPFFPVFLLQLNAIKNGVSSDVAFYWVNTSDERIYRIFWPAITPWIGIYNVVIPCVEICSILIFCSITVKSAVATFTFAALYGLLAGGYMGLLAPTIGPLARKDSEIGARMGICFTFTGEL
ncbi:uncharacterized protein BT62DRAFT_979560 [Guyanagaster necrorhizus]|uniref:Uncharacterized protein n=1 Tax=Guyanagaster necrorhizus TaxID=856835 RepID=A0A9P8AUK5_9AGAR|nr:uncharacterized protein BT62DRAFT_979560 [Guyanagaster necrorhizus MCA 3950]KAG7448594.1 hypothetical protein BT62DRAFT_979560 [Guyanagaster necrorhizus MCA 3950]